MPSVIGYHHVTDHDHWLQSEDGAAAAASDGVLLDTLVFLVES
jgi:hypothetical protein